MPNTKRIAPATLALGLFAAASLPAPQTAEAATSTSTLAVTVEVVETCSIDGGTLDFGAYSGGQSSALEASGSIAYLGCSAGTLSLELDGGNSGDEAARKLENGQGDGLAYQLYRNSSKTQIFGSGGNAMVLQLLVSGSGAVPVYGRIPGGQNVPAGSYSDAVNVTLTF